MVTAHTELEAALTSAVSYLAENIPDHYPRDVISYSCLKELRSCPMRWKFKYINKVDLPKSIQMAVGDAIHRGIEHHYLGDDAVEVALARFNTLATSGLYTQAECRKSLVIVERVTGAYVATHPDQRHDAVEQRLSVELARGVRIECVTDLYLDQTVIDHKTAKGAQFAPDPLQIVINAMVLVANGMPVKHGIVRQLRKDVTGRMKAYPICIDHQIELTPDVVRAGALEIKSRLDEIDARIRLDAWGGPPLPREEAARICAYACPIPGVMTCPARVF